jgi:uncharacterized protein (TIGR02145 family)
MKNIYLIFFLLASALVYAEDKDITISCNDSTFLAGKTLEFHPSVSPILPDKDTVKVESSDTNVVKIKNEFTKTGEPNEAIIKGFGTSWITINPKGNSNIKTGFRINVKDTRKENTNELAHGFIISKDGSSQYAENGVDQDAKFRSLLQRFHTKKLVKQSKAVRITWDVIPDPEKVAQYGNLPNDSVVQFYNTSEDSTDVFMKLAGNHSIILVATDGTKKDTISSFKYSRIGEDYPDYSYIVSADMFGIVGSDGHLYDYFYSPRYNQNLLVNLTNKKIVNFSPNIGEEYYNISGDSVYVIYTGSKTYVKDNIVYYEPNGSYRIIDADVNQNIKVVSKTDVTWDEEGKVVDSRDSEEYKIRRIGNDQIWMTENMRYTGGFTKVTTVSTNVTDATPKYMIHTANKSHGHNYGKDVDFYLYNGRAIWGGSQFSSGSSTYNVDDLIWQGGVCPSGWRLPNTNDFHSLYKLADPTTESNIQHNTSNPDYNNGRADFGSNSYLASYNNLITGGSIGTNFYTNFYGRKDGTITSWTGNFNFATARSALSNSLTMFYIANSTGVTLYLAYISSKDYAATMLLVRCIK